ncbi:MAG: hypothetical protein H6925_07165 [Holosporaceae bacterium]|nr:MAG: hypothetical protein H6925_07165 [Holosporaceae bacterium]
MTETTFFPNLQADHLQKIDDKTSWMVLSKSLQSILCKSREDLLSNLENLRLRERDIKASDLFQKWGVFMSTSTERRQIVLDASYSGPGGEVSQHILKTDTLLVLEGLIVSAYILNAPFGYIYVPASEKALIQHLEGIVETLYAEGVIHRKKTQDKWSFDLNIHYGEAGFVGVGDRCVLRSMDTTSKEHALYGGVDCVIQAETAAILPQALKMGPEKFSKTGTHDSVGHKVLSFNGHVNRVGFVEVSFGVLL